jgi:hypothetical protein
MDMPTPLVEHGDCRKISGILARVGDKWTVLVVMTLREHSRRFNEIKRTVGGISQQMLTRTLKALERDGMVMRTVVPRRARPAPWRMGARASRGDRGEQGKLRSLGDRNPPSLHVRRRSLSAAKGLPG